MITKIAIENFKGIRDRLEFELKPITMLFGANSAGKSTVLHALHLAREVFERHNLNPDRTVAGGDYVDLGGFEGFVHGRDRTREVAVELTVEVEESGFPDFGANYEAAAALLDVDFATFVRSASTCSVEVRLAWSVTHRQPHVSCTKVAIDGETLAILRADSNLGGAFFDTLNTQHGSLTKVGDLRVDGHEQVELFDDETLLTRALESVRPLLAASSDSPLELAGRGDALPDFGEPLEFSVEPVELSPPPKGSSDQELQRFQERRSEADQLAAFAEEFAKALSEVVFGPLQLVCDALTSFRYLGPLRETPPRNYQTPRFPDASRWASGLGAWDALHSAPDSFVAEVGDWLGDEDRLDSGYRVERTRYKELNLGDPYIRKLLAGRAFDEADDSSPAGLESTPSMSRLVIVPNGSDLELRPHDVGIGISQVVPVVAMALDGEKRLLAIEQPELHLHPRLQADLGGLFAAAVRKPRGHWFIVETHSEHLVLRMQRLVREGVLSHADVNVLYVSNVAKGTAVSTLRLDNEGDFVDEWPGGFFPERLRELR